MGGMPTRSVKRSASTERDNPASLPKSSIVQSCAGLACISDSALPTNARWLSPPTTSSADATVTIATGR